MLFFIFCIGISQLFAQKISYEKDMFLLSGKPMQHPDKLKEMIKDIEDDKELEQSLKGKILRQYRQAVNLLDTADLFNRRSQVFFKFLNEAPAEMEKIKGQIRQINIEKKAVNLHADMSDLSRAELDRKYDILQSEILMLKESLSLLDKQLEWLKSRPAGIKEELATARKLLHDIDEELKNSKIDKENTLLIEARRTALMAGRYARIKEIQMLNNELACYGHQIRILDAQRELENEKIAKAQLLLKPYERVINERLKVETEKSRAAAALEEIARKKKPLVIRGIAEKNIKLSKEIEEATEGIRQTSLDKDAIQIQLKHIEQNISDIKKKTQVAELGKAIGHIILEQLRNLPDVKNYEKKNKKLEKKISDVWLQQTNVDELFRPLSDIEKEVRRIIAENVDVNMTMENPKDIEDEIRNLLNERKALLSKLSDILAMYIDSLGELEAAQKRLITSINEYSTFLEKKVLWIPNAQTIGKKVFEDFKGIVSDNFNLSTFTEITKVLHDDTKRNPMLVLLFFVVVVPLFWCRKHLFALIESINRKVVDPVMDNFILTLKALSAVFIAALPIPLTLSFVGWRLLDGFEATVFTRALGNALLVVSYGVFYFRFIYFICLKNGVAEIHFNWDAERLAKFIKEINWFFPILLSSIFLFVLFWSIPHVEKGGPGRFFIIIAMMATAIMLYRLLNPNYGLFKEYMRKHQDGWLYKLRYVWYPMSVSIPLVLVYITSVGYIYTSIKLFSHLFDTFWLVIWVVILHSLVVRWITITNRRITFHKNENIHEKDIDMPEINAQTRKLLNIFVGIVFIIGLLVVWAKIFPALSALDQVSLWHSTAVVGSKEIQHSITLLNLILAIIFVITTIVIARNIPGTLEVVLLQNLPISAGSRYAITHLSRYLIVLFGVVAVFKTMGVGWSNIQWLVAALGVGLGFGLQEIFGNLISGIIILFEKPIRLGDTVTIGDVTGTVSRINVRATTIVDWDNKELIIPNKAFITGQLVNWTLTNPITRIKMKVGIAYGSDTKLAHQVILNTVKSNPLVLEDPEPRVNLLGFGDSSLDFTIFAYTRQLSDRLQLTHELHMDIERKLRENGISIPFPQRDVHIKQ